MKFNKRSVRRWMLDNAAEYRDKMTDELNLTALVEAAAAAFDVAETGGPLDDETHWIWELASAVESET